MKFGLLFSRVKRIEPARLFSLTAPGSVSVSTACPGNGRKKSSQYSSVNTEKYSSIVKSVVSLRTSCQTPASLEEEDGHIYGPVVKSKPARKLLPKTQFALVNRNSDRIDLTPEAERGTPARFALERGAGKFTTPSVTHILRQTIPPDQAFYLERWRKNMIALLGEDGFNDYTLHIFQQGKLFHSALETLLLPEKVSAEPTESSEAVEGYLESIQHVLRHIGDVRAVESAVRHQPLLYQGLVDCVAQFRGKLCVIDWKTSEKPKPSLRSTYDNPLQVAAYIGAINNDDNYKYQVERGLIVVAYKDGSPAHPHFMTSELCQEYWTKWLLRLEEFVERQPTASTQ